MRFYKVIWKSEKSGVVIEGYLRAKDKERAEEYLRLRLAKESKITELTEIQEQEIMKNAFCLNFSKKEGSND